MLAQPGKCFFFSKLLHVCDSAAQQQHASSATPHFRFILSVLVPDSSPGRREEPGGFRGPSAGLRVCRGAGQGGLNCQTSAGAGEEVVIGLSSPPPPSVTAATPSGG